jgi:hypothetical protein
MGNQDGRIPAHAGRPEIRNPPDAALERFFKILGGLFKDGSVNPVGRLGSRGGSYSSSSRSPEAARRSPKVTAGRARTCARALLVPGRIRYQIIGTNGATAEKTASVIEKIAKTERINERVDGFLQ